MRVVRVAIGTVLIRGGCAGPAERGWLAGMTSGPPPVIGWALPVAVLLVACAADDPCAAASADPDCADLRFGGRLYDEWREVPASTAGQEVGNATYPACNAAEGCPGSEFEGFGATDVWLLNGADIEDAVIGIREGTETYVVFVRRGVDPATLPTPPAVPQD